MTSSNFTVQNFNTSTKFGFEAGEDPIKGIDTENNSTTNNYVPTGIVIKLDLPIIYDNPSNAVLAFNTDGFIPQKNMFKNEEDYLRILKNMFPVQLVNKSTAAPSPFRISYTENTLPILTKYISHRLVRGQVGIGIRLSSNTTQTGNIKLTAASRIERKYDFNAPALGYAGLETISGPITNIQYQTKSFSVADLSLQRQWNIISSRTSPMTYTDLAFKLYSLGRAEADSGLPVNARPAFQQQFQEDWVLLSIDTDIPSAETNQLTFEVFFDYSQIEFEQPMLNKVVFGSGTLLNISDIYGSEADPTKILKSFKDSKSEKQKQNEKLQITRKM